MAKITQAIREFATLLIRAYRYLISPFFPPSCRFYPSCSEYTLQAIQQHGLLRGTYLGTRRICRCHPLSEGGFDPVPASQIPPRNNSNLSADSALAAPDNNNNG